MRQSKFKGQPRTYKAGRPDIKIHHYDESGNFIKTFPNQKEVFNEYYGGKTGQLFDDNKQFKELPDKTIICKERLGRDGIKILKRIYNSKYCYKQTESRPFSIYNLLGEKIYSFSGIDAYIRLTGATKSNIKEILENNKNHFAELRFQYDDIDKEVLSVIDSHTAHNMRSIDKEMLSKFLLRSYIVDDTCRLIKEDSEVLEEV